MPKSLLRPEASEVDLPPRSNSPKLGDFSAIYSVLRSNLATIEEPPATPKPEQTQPRPKFKNARRAASDAEKQYPTFSGGFLAGLNLSLMSSRDDASSSSSSDASDSDDTDTLDDTEATEATDSDDIKRSWKSPGFTFKTQCKTRQFPEDGAANNGVFSQWPAKTLGRDSPAKRNNDFLDLKKFASLPTPGPAQESVQVTLPKEQYHSINRAQPVAQPTCLGGHKYIKPLYRATPDQKLRKLQQMLKAFKDHNGCPADFGPLAGPIHVFVDLSNITIGFSQTVRAARSYGKHQNMPEIPFFFQAFMQILERDRPVARKVLAGSVGPGTNNTNRAMWKDYMRDAEKLGFETNILTRVSKPGPRPPPPPRQPRNLSQSGPGCGYGQQQQQQQQTGFSQYCSYAPATVSGGVFPLYSVQNNGFSTAFDPVTNGPGMSQVYPVVESQPRADDSCRGEQAVDEVLHLKMLESAMDYSPATMVLATGDGNAGEFSDGFMRQAERVLVKGWHVEVLAWRTGISSAWKELELDYPHQVRIFELDDYVEEMLRL